MSYTKFLEIAKNSIGEGAELVAAMVFDDRHVTINQSSLLANMENLADPTEPFAEDVRSGQLAVHKEALAALKQAKSDVADGQKSVQDFPFRASEFSSREPMRSTSYGDFYVKRGNERRGGNPKLNPR